MMVALSLLLLIVGTLIYVFFRPLYLPINEFLALSGIDIVGLRESLSIGNAPPFVSNSLPAACWSLSWVFLMKFVWSNCQSFKEFAFWIILIPFSGIGSEISQYFGVIPGTWDNYDFLLYLAVIVFAAYSVVSQKLNTVSKTVAVKNQPTMRTRMPHNNSMHRTSPRAPADAE